MNSKKNDVSDNDDDDDDVSDEDEDDFHECKVAGDKGKSCYFVQLVVLVIRIFCLSVVSSIIGSIFDSIFASIFDSIIGHIFGYIIESNFVSKIVVMLFVVAKVMLYKSDRIVMMREMLMPVKVGEWRLHEGGEWLWRWVVIVRIMENDEDSEWRMMMMVENDDDGEWWQVIIELGLWMEAENIIMITNTNNVIL